MDEKLFWVPKPENTHKNMFFDHISTFIEDMNTGPGAIAVEFYLASIAPGPVFISPINVEIWSKNLFLGAKT